MEDLLLRAHGLGSFRDLGEDGQSLSILTVSTIAQSVRSQTKSSLLPVSGFERTAASVDFVQPSRWEQSMVVNHIQGAQSKRVATIASGVEGVRSALL